MNESEMHYEDCIMWFVYWILELGPLRVYRNVNEVLSEELLNRLEEGSWGAKDILKFVEEINEYEHS